MKFWARIPVKAFMWMGIEAKDAYTAEAEAITAAAKLDNTEHVLPGDRRIKIAEAPLGRVVLIRADDSPADQADDPEAGLDMVD